MYRHFATATVAITALMAFFANGANQRTTAAVATPVAEVHQPQAPPKPQLEIAPDAYAGSWGSDAVETVEQTVIGAYASARRSSAKPFALDEARRGPAGSVDDDAEESENGDTSAIPTASQISAIEAASRMRSGTRGNN